jgi:hypothetical protein
MCRPARRSTAARSNCGDISAGATGPDHSFVVGTAGGGPRRRVGATAPDLPDRDERRNPIQRPYGRHDPRVPVLRAPSVDARLQPGLGAPRSHEPRDDLRSSADGRMRPQQPAHRSHRSRDDAGSILLRIAMVDGTIGGVVRRSRDRSARPVLPITGCRRHVCGRQCQQLPDEGRRKILARPNRDIVADQGDEDGKHERTRGLPDCTRLPPRRIRKL